jgi:hypothetical protein
MLTMKPFLLIFIFLTTLSCHTFAYKINHQNVDDSIAIEKQLSSLSEYFKPYDNSVLQKVNKISQISRKYKSYYNLGECYRQKGLYFSWHGDCKKAILYMNASKTLFTMLRHSLSDAFRCYTLFHHLYDSLNIAAHHKNFSKLFADLELNSKDISINKLSKEKELKNSLLMQKEAELKESKRHIYLYLAIIVLLILLIISTSFFIKQKIEQKQNLLSNQLLTFKLQALTQQINPHFIFNILNSIQYGIINNDLETSSKYIARFSNLLRKVLENSQHHYIELYSEIESLQLYMELEQMRLKNKFNFVIYKSNNIDFHKFYLPPLLLEPFLENAIWHGIMNIEDTNIQGMITISFNEVDSGIVCIIEDNGVGITKSEVNKNFNKNSHFELGIAISKNRILIFNQLFNTNMSVKIIDLANSESKQSGTKVIITIPTFSSHEV